MTDETLETTADVARRLNVCASYVRELARRGDLPHYRIGTTLRFRVADVEAFIAARRVGA